METINPKSMFTKGQTAYSIALLSYKDDETEKIITHTISKVGRSFVYDEKETKYHYSNKYKAFISADAFHHQQAIFPTEKAVQEYLERSRLYFDLIRLNSYDWDDLTLAELRSVGEIILKDHKKAFVKNPTVEEINHAETLSKNVSDGEDADTILADLCEETSMEEPGLAYDVFNTWKAAQTSHEREYITASIILQLLGVIFPQVKELQQCKTKADKRKYEWILVFSGAGLACLESLTMAIGFGRKGLLTKYKWYYVLLITVIWTIMATLTSIIGKIISVKLVGNGISLILVSNILSSYPSDSANIYEVLMKGKKTYIAGLHLFFLLILITALFIFTVWLQDTEKKIPVTYSGKLQGKSTFKGVSTNTIPIKLCPGGVVPIIFASSLISFPILIAQIAGAKQNAVLKLLNSGYWFNTSKPWYTFGALIYLVLIFAFSYFYTEITMNPEEIANNIKKSGGNIAGIRAGSSTAEYLRKQMKYLIAIGSFCLCIIAIIPFIVSGLTGLSRLSFFGTSIIITVSVILETKKLILSKTQENYYMNRVKKGGLFRG